MLWMPPRSWSVSAGIVSGTSAAMTSNIGGRAAHVIARRDHRVGTSAWRGTGRSARPSRPSPVEIADAGRATAATGLERHVHAQSGDAGRLAHARTQLSGNLTMED